MPPGFHLLMAAQFASALADNALLIVAIALLEERGYAGWWAPLLKFAFTLSYVLLAPFVGPLADALPKQRLMAWMNGVKILGLLALLAGLHPALAFAVVGFGAAAYAPAKYGLVTELVPPQRLVAANGWIEVSVVCAALAGTVLGGVLVGPLLGDAAVVAGAQALLATAGADQPSRLAAALLALLLAYALAAALNCGIPDSGARYPACGRHPAQLTRDFLRANRALWRDREGGLSLAVTTLFWGVGATLQLAVLRWAVDVLGLPLSRAAALPAVVALGVVAGAALAGQRIGLAAAPRVLPAGVLLGLLIPVVALLPGLTASPWALLPLLALTGAVGGLLVVPMNALLQHRGHQLLSAGRSIAVQGYNENLSVLAMMAGYAGLLWLELPIVPLMCGFGLAIAAGVAALMRRRPLPPPGFSPLSPPAP